jgi:hypothetical protein
MWPAMHHEKTVWRCDARPALIANSFLYPSLTQQTLNIIEILVHNKASALTWKHFTRTARLSSLHTGIKKARGHRTSFRVNEWFGRHLFRPVGLGPRLTFASTRSSLHSLTRGAFLIMSHHVEIRQRLRRDKICISLRTVLIYYKASVSSVLLRVIITSKIRALPPTTGPMSTGLSATALFLNSWEKADRYPLGLIKQGANIGSLRAQEKLLSGNAPNLFYSKSNVKVFEFDQNEGTKGTVPSPFNPELMIINHSDEKMKTSRPKLTPASQISSDH